MTACPFVLPGHARAARPSAGAGPSRPAEPRRRRPARADRDVADRRRTGARSAAAGARAAGHGGRVAQQGLPARPRPHPARGPRRHRSACTGAPWWRWSARAAPASRPWPGCSPVRSGSPRARSALDGEPGRPVRRAGPSGATRARCSWSSRTRSPRSTPCTRCAITWSARCGCTRAASRGPRSAGEVERLLDAGAADPGRPVHRQVPARAVRRPAPAGLVRPGAGGQADRAAGRRAGVHAGRLDPAGDAQPARRPAQAVPAGAAVHHPRHRLGPVLRRRGAGDVRRRDRRARPGRGADPAARHTPTPSCWSPPRRTPTTSAAGCAPARTSFRSPGAGRRGRLRRRGCRFEPGARWPTTTAGAADARSAPALPARSSRPLPRLDAPALLPVSPPAAAAACWRPGRRPATATALPARTRAGSEQTSDRRMSSLIHHDRKTKTWEVLLRRRSVMGFAAEPPSLRAGWPRARRAERRLERRCPRRSARRRP